MTTVLRVSEVQGAVSDLVSGPRIAPRSPRRPATASSSQLYDVRGVITQRTLARSSAGRVAERLLPPGHHGPRGRRPDDLGRDLRLHGQLHVADRRLRARGRRRGRPPGARLGVLQHDPALERFARRGRRARSLDVDAVAPAFEADPPDDLADAGRYWERREGMRGRVLAGARRRRARATCSPRPRTARSGSSAATRRSRSGRARTRAERSATPTRSTTSPGLVDNGNGYRILLGPLGVKAHARALDLTLLAARPGLRHDRRSAVVGGVDFSFNKYRINPVDAAGVHGRSRPVARTRRRAAFARDGAYSVANFNVENLYDFRDDPFDGCDFAGNTGCPGVSPPFDYVPASAGRLRRAPRRARGAGGRRPPRAGRPARPGGRGPGHLHRQRHARSPAARRTTRDGKPDTLQELALRIAAVGGPAYDAAYDRDGADDRGIVAAFLYRTDRVELLPATGDPVLGASPTVAYRGAALAYNTDVQNPKALNADLPSDVDTSTGVDGSNVFTRAPQVGHFRVWRNGIDASGSASGHGSTSTRSRTTSRRRPTPASGSGGSRPPTSPRS